MKKIAVSFALCVFLSCTLAWAGAPAGADSNAPAVTNEASQATTTSTVTPTVEEAQKFMDETEAKLAELGVLLNKAGWVAETYINDDTEAIVANDEPVQVLRKLLPRSMR